MHSALPGCARCFGPPSPRKPLPDPPWSASSQLPVGVGSGSSLRRLLLPISRFSELPEFNFMNSRNSQILRSSRSKKAPAEAGALDFGSAAEEPAGLVYVTENGGETRPLAVQKWGPLDALVDTVELALTGRVPVRGRPRLRLIPGGS